jgi:hypothetical protein
MRTLTRRVIQTTRAARTTSLTPTPSWLSLRPDRWAQGCQPQLLAEQPNSSRLIHLASQIAAKGKKVVLLTADKGEYTRTYEMCAAPPPLARACDPPTRPCPCLAPGWIFTSQPAWIRPPDHCHPGILQGVQTPSSKPVPECNSWQANVAVTQPTTLCPAAFGGRLGEHGDAGSSPASTAHRAAPGPLTATSLRLRVQVQVQHRQRGGGDAVVPNGGDGLQGAPVRRLPPPHAVRAQEGARAALRRTGPCRHLTARLLQGAALH